MFDLVREFLHDEVLGREDKVLATYLKAELLIIDDMGMKQLPRRSGECLFEVVMRRYETRSTMMTSNRPLEDWGKLRGDVTERDGDLGSVLASRRDRAYDGPKLSATTPTGHGGTGGWGFKNQPYALRLGKRSTGFKTSLSALRLGRRSTGIKTSLSAFRV